MKNLGEIKFDAKKKTQAGMTLPEGFFEQFQQQLEAKIDEMEDAKKQAPVIQMPVRNNSWGRWAVAACAMVLVSLGAFLMFDNESSEQAGAVQVASSEKSDEQLNDMQEMMMHSVSDYDLYEYYCEL